MASSLQQYSRAEVSEVYSTSIGQDSLALFRGGIKNGLIYARL